MFTFLTKSVQRILLVLCVIICLFFGTMALLILDPKDHCLDYGGRYNDITKTCEK